MERGGGRRTGGRLGQAKARESQGSAEAGLGGEERQGRGVRVWGKRQVERAPQRRDREREESAEAPPRLSAWKRKRERNHRCVEEKEDQQRGCSTPRARDSAGGRRDDESG
eukprot:2872095-Rhodomonas_salina.1